MKYHKHIIKKVYADLGEINDRLNYIYEIYKDGKYINTAKDFIDSGYNTNYL